MKIADKITNMMQNMLRTAQACPARAARELPDIWDKRRVAAWKRHRPGWNRAGERRWLKMQGVR